ncbi:MAG TPA: hybrid sensor histidine kinase/response regulator [Kofleriaceae bacterium]|nr:hybrid sensor histidine kinase/response regulator [Kofleriaceae bacterium]
MENAERDEPVCILIVDDVPANLMALESVLEPLGQEVLLARSGTEALEVLEKHDCALVLMDVHMPLLDGYQTVEVIRNRQHLRHLPVMFLTAMYRDQASASRGYALGAVDFVMKPFEAEIIRAKVSAFVALQQHTQRLKRQERKLAKEVAAREAAEQANHLKEEFIAVLGHDLRTPLQAILMTAEKHGHLPSAEEPCRRDGKRIQAIANRMGRMIDHVVDYTRSRLGGGIPIEVEAVDMGELVRAPLDEIQAVYPQSLITFVTEGDLHGAWDPDRVVQVFANLVGNAARHGDGPVRISLRGLGESVVLETHNGGAPIPMDKMEHLFEPFYTSGRQGSLGLGLYIVERIVHAHGGSIRAESSADRGTTFIVRWPRQAAVQRPNRESQPGLRALQQR